MRESGDAHGEIGVEIGTNNVRSPTGRSKHLGFVPAGEVSIKGAMTIAESSSRIEASRFGITERLMALGQS